MSTRYATFDTDLSPAEQMQIKEAGSNAEFLAQLAEQVKQAAQEPSLCETCCHAYHGFKECFRVLEKHGLLLFKWSETDIKLSVVLELCPYRPLLGTRTTPKSHFLTFIKEEDMLK